MFLLKLRSGPGLHSVRELEQGKESVRMDKANIALAMFGMEAIPGEIEKKESGKGCKRIKGRFLGENDGK